MGKSREANIISLLAIKSARDVSGIAGAVGPGLGDIRQLGTRMAATLNYRSNHIDLWSQDDAVLCRVHHESTSAYPQPVVSSDGTKRLLLWGDLYDTARLRRMIGTRPLQRENSDAELVLRLFEQLGEDAFRTLDGSYSIAVYDGGTRELVLATDRFSSRPLYWAKVGRAIVFATQVNSVLQAAGMSRDLDDQSVREFFHYQRVHGTKTLSKAVSMLPSGSVLRASKGKTHVRPSFDMRYEPENHSHHDWADEMASAFRLSVHRAMSGGKRVGLLLSGGLDSRMVVAAASRELVCFHFNDSENQEHETARRIAGTRNLPFHYLKRPANHYVDLLEQSVDIGNGQYGFVHSHSIGLLPENQVDLMLHAWAPELYFRGKNLPHKKYRLFGKQITKVLDPDLTPENIAAKMASKLPYSIQSSHPETYFTPRWRRDFQEMMVASAQELVHEAQNHSQDPYDWYLWPDARYHCKYPSFLFEAALRPFHSERSIVFHNHILDLHLRMPVEMRKDSRIWNHALRSMAPDIAAIPDANTGHSPFLPSLVAFMIDKGNRVARELRILPKPKFGPAQTSHSWPHFGELIRHHQGFRHAIESTINDPESLDPSIFDIPRIKLAFTEHLSGRVNHDSLLILVATFGTWHRKYGPPGQALP